jgi:hypothetical protein
MKCPTYDHRHFHDTVPTVIFFNASSSKMRLRDMAPIALDSAVFTALLLLVLLFSVLANSQAQKQCRALAAKSMELLASGKAFTDEGTEKKSSLGHRPEGETVSRLCAGLEIMMGHLEINARKHRLFGLTDVTPSLLLKVRVSPCFSLFLLLQFQHFQYAFFGWEQRRAFLGWP